MIVRVLSYNIHKGFDFRQRRFVLDAIRSAIREVRADLVFLQEVVGEHRTYEKLIENWPNESQFEYLADGVWTHYAYGKNAVYDDGHHGNAILSRFPIVKKANIPLVSHAGEQRGLLHCAVQIPETGQILPCFCTHLGLVAKGRALQFRAVCEEVERQIPNHSALDSGPFIVAGDFNDWDRRACRLLEARLSIRDVGKVLRGHNQRTFPSVWPLLALDRIYTHGMRVLDVGVLRGSPWRKLSDHCPLYAELEWPDAVEFRTSDRRSNHPSET